MSDNALPDEATPKRQRMKPGQRRWVFVVPPIYGVGEFSFTAAGRRHRTDVSDATYAMGHVWTITVSPTLRTTLQTKILQ